jgi:hypothetical protein
MVNDYPECGQIERIDVDAYLSERGLVAVPLEPTEAMIDAGLNMNDECCGYDVCGVTLAAIYERMIAAQEKGDE